MELANPLNSAVMVRQQILPGLVTPVTVRRAEYMANVTEVKRVSGPDHDFNMRTDQYEKNNDVHARSGGRREKKCETLVRTTTVAAMITAVWGLIIVSVASPFFPRGFETTVQNISGVDDNPNGSVTGTLAATSQSAVLSTINCSDAFFASNGMCLPRCDKWKQYPEDLSIILDVVIILSSVARVVFGTFALVASCFNWRRMFAFPAVLIVHLNVVAVASALLDLISISGRGALFCSSPSLIDALNKSTPFCSMSGTIYYYFIFHACFCWFCHIATLFWQIMFPFHARIYKMQGRNKFLYIAVLVPSLVLPAVPAFAAFVSGGFTMRQFPPLLCVTKNETVLFFTLILPISLMTGVANSLLILIIAKHIKHQGKVQSAQNKNSFGSTADKKILFIMCYLVCFNSLYSASNSVSSLFTAQFTALVNKYFACEANAYDSKIICSSDKMAYEAFTFTGTVITIIFYFLLGAFPAVTLTFIVRLKKREKMMSKSTS